MRGMQNCVQIYSTVLTSNVTVMSGKSHFCWRPKRLRSCEFKSTRSSESRVAPFAAATDQTHQSCRSMTPGSPVLLSMARTVSEIERDTFVSL